MLLGLGKLFQFFWYIDGCVSTVLVLL